MSPCVGIGGTIKRLFARACLHATEDNHILISHQAFTWTSANIQLQGIAFLHVTSEDITERANKFGVEDYYS